MFQNAYQSGSYFEVFHAKTDKEKDKTYDKLYKISNPGGVAKVYDKITKGYIFELDRGVRTSIQFPFSDKQDLGLIQPFLVFQMLLSHGSAFSIEVSITDTAKNKRRLHFISGLKQIEKNYFHAKIPIDIVKRGTWVNLSIDLVSFFELFKGQTFRSIESFSIGATCKLRRIYTMRNPLYDHSSEDTMLQTEGRMIPKTQNFPQGVSYTNQLITLDAIKAYCLQNEPNYHDQTTLGDLTTGGVSASVLYPRGVLTPANRGPGSHRKAPSMQVQGFTPKGVFSARNENKSFLRMDEKSVNRSNIKDNKENIKQNNIPKSSEKKSVHRPVLQVQPKARRDTSPYTNKSSIVENNRRKDKDSLLLDNHLSPYGRQNLLQSFTSTFERDYNATGPSVKGFESDMITPKRSSAIDTLKQTHITDTGAAGPEFVNLSKLIENHRRKNPEVLMFEEKPQEQPRWLGKRASTSIKKTRELPAAKDYGWAETCEFIRLEDLVSAQKKPIMIDDFSEKKPLIEFSEKKPLVEFSEKKPIKIDFSEKKTQMLITPDHQQRNQKPIIISDQKSSENSNNNNSNSSNIISQSSHTKRKLDNNVWENTFGSPQNQDFKGLTWKSFKTDEKEVAPILSTTAKKERPEIETNPFLAGYEKEEDKRGWKIQEDNSIKEEEESQSEENAPYDEDKESDFEERRAFEESSIAKVSSFHSHSPEKSLEIRDDFSKDNKHMKSVESELSREFMEEIELGKKDDFLFANTEKSTGTRWFTTAKKSITSNFSSTKKRENIFTQNQANGLFESGIGVVRSGDAQDGGEIKLQETAQKKNSLVVLEDSDDEENLEDSLDKLVSEYVDYFKHGDKKKAEAVESKKIDKSLSPPWKQTLIMGDTEQEEDKWLSRWIDNVDISKIAHMKEEEEPPKKEEIEESHEIEVIYDPVWNCYYHPKTNAYFEIKE